MTQPERNNNDSMALLDWYASQLSSHVEAMVGIFFGLIGILVLISQSRNQFGAIVLFSLIYFGLGIVGGYFYIKLVYAHQMVEEFLFRLENFKQQNKAIQDEVMKRFKGHRWSIYTWFLGISEKDGRYDLLFAWLGGFAYILVVGFGFIAVML